MNKKPEQPAQSVDSCPEIDYTALIHAAYAINKRWAQGTAGCVAFKHGAEWYRSQVKGDTPPPAPAGYAKKIESLIAERDALKAKLAEQPAQQEPVIQDWMKPDALCDRSCLYACTEGFTKFPTCVPPPSHTSRIGLTDEEFVELCSADLGTAALIRAVEAKLKKKNT